MRLPSFIALVPSLLIASIGLASDVEYKLDEKIFARPNASISIQPGEFKIVDRAWAAPGIEHSFRDLLPPVDFDFTAAPQVRIEAAEDCPNTGYHWGFQRRHVGPRWLDNVAWPLTRELFCLGIPDDSGNNYDEYNFGGIVLQR